MSRTEDRAIGDRLADLEQLAARIQPIRIRTWIVCMRRREPWACELRTADDVHRFAVREPEPVEAFRRLDLDVLLDPRTGARKFRHEVEDVEAYDRLAAQAELVDLELTVHDKQLAALLAVASIIAVLGGNRAGKTRVGLYWLIRQWLLRGHGKTEDGPAALFWLLAPSKPLAWKRLTKDLAPLIPRRLRVGKLPKSHRAASQSITMIDGSTIEAHYTNDDGGNLKSENVSAILFDEAAESKDAGNWQQVNSRVSQRGAPVFLSTTPVAGHWAYSEIVLQEPHAGGAIEVHHLDLFDNPWLTTARIWRLFLSDGTLTQPELEEAILVSADPIAACRGLVEGARALREHFGIWTADGITLWAEWTDEVARACTRAGGTLEPVTIHTHLGELGNITAQVASQFFRNVDPERLEQVWGQDFNVNPQTCVRVQVHGRPDDPETWCLYAIEEVQVQGTVERQAARMQQVAPGAAIACDPSGDIPRRDQTATDGDEASRMRAHGFACRSAVGRGRRLRSQKPTLDVLHRLMRQRRLIVNLRCKNLIRALQMQQATAEGRIAKRAGVNSPSDQLSSPTDALRYIAFALMKHEVEAPAQFFA